MLNKSIRIFCLSVLSTLLLPSIEYTQAEEIHEEKTLPLVSATYTITNATGQKIDCVISSDDTIDTLNKLKNSECELPIFNKKEHSPITLTTRNSHNETKQFLLTTRSLLMWAHSAIHLYKIWDSGSKLFWPSICPCSGKPVGRTKTQGFFFTYFSLSFLHHGWSSLTSYFPPEKKTHQYPVKAYDNDHHTPENAETHWTDTLTNILSPVSEYPYASHLLSLAIDSAALKWDCRCAGYFTDSNGGFYFNGHLWMLLLDIAIFTTDLALDYL